MMQIYKISATIATLFITGIAMYQTHRAEGLLLENKLLQVQRNPIEFPAIILSIEPDMDYEIASYKVTDINGNMAIIRDQYGLFQVGDQIRPEIQEKH